MISLRSLSCGAPSKLRSRSFRELVWCSGVEADAVDFAVVGSLGELMKAQP
jgi:hypothetical protein